MLELIETINRKNGKSSFKKAGWADQKYIISQMLPAEISEFYKTYNPVETVELNGIRLIPVSEIREENTNYVPGYVLNPMGYCVIASTIYGDVYCVKKNGSRYSVVLASHDLIHEGMADENVRMGTLEICSSFREFLDLFVNEKLPDDFHYLK